MTSTDIKQLIEDLLERMHITVQSIDVASSDGRERFSVNTPDSHVLIGTNGDHLLAFNHLVKKIVAQKNIAKRVSTGDPTGTALQNGGERGQTFFIDVNGYQEAALENIKNVAKVMGERARSFKTNVELLPMSYYERMIVHSFFEGAKDLKTESAGEGDKRRVVIKY